GHPVGDGPVGGAQAGGHGVVGAHDPRTGAGEKAVEGVDERLPAAVVLEVVGLDAGHDPHIGPEIEECAIALVGLHHEPFTRAPHRAAADLVDLAAHDERRRQPRLDQHEGEHRRRRRLAVGAGHCSRAAGGGDGGQHRRPAVAGDAALLGDRQLGVGGGNGRREGDGVRVADIRGRVTDYHRDTCGGEPIEAGRRLEVAAGDGVAHGGEDGGDGTHSRPADADDVDALRARQIELGRAAHHALWRATLSITPIAAMVMTSDEPPNDTNGRGTPVIGSMPMTAPMLMIACTTTQAVTPDATSMPNRSGARVAVRTPNTARAANRATMRMAPSRPSSSPMMAKMKSVWALGRKPNLARLAPNPTPKMPPLPSPTRLWASW